MRPNISPVTLISIIRAHIDSGFDRNGTVITTMEIRPINMPEAVARIFDWIVYVACFLNNAERHKQCDVIYKARAVSAFIETPLKASSQNTIYNIITLL